MVKQQDEIKGLIQKNEDTIAQLKKLAALQAELNAKKKLDSDKKLLPAPPAVYPKTVTVVTKKPKNVTITMPVPVGPHPDDQGVEQLPAPKKIPEIPSEIKPVSKVPTSKVTPTVPISARERAIQTSISDKNVKYLLYGCFTGYGEISLVLSGHVYQGEPVWADCNKKDKDGKVILDFNTYKYNLNNLEADQKSLE